MPGYAMEIVGRGFSAHTQSKTRTWQGLAMREVLPGISHRTINGSVVPVAWNYLNYVIDKTKPVYATIIKADIGGVGGHVVVHPHVMQEVIRHIAENSQDLISAFFVSGAGDDISINLVHQRGYNDPAIQQLCFKAFDGAIETARQLGLYGPGQDMVKTEDSEGKMRYVFEQTGNISGAGPSIAEIMLDPIQTQNQVLFVWSDKTDPGSYSIPLYKSFGQIWMQDSQILAFSNARNGNYFLVQDVELKDAAAEMGKTTDEVGQMGSGLVMLRSGVDDRMIATILSDRDRFAIKAIFGIDENGRPARRIVSVSTDKLHNIGGEYLGKDDPVMLMLAQKDQAAPGEIVRAGWSKPFLVAGNCRGSHNAVLMPSVLFSGTEYSSNPVVTSATVSVHTPTGYIGGMVDNFYGPAWEHIRQQAAIHDTWFHEAHGFFQPKELNKGALEYQKGFMEALKIASRMRRYFDLNGPTSMDDAATALVDLTGKIRAEGVAAAKHTGPEVD
ncbi:MAG: fructose 1,6-bisphosphatase [Candidatus Margulisiibacteriota bacterium]